MGGRRAQTRVPTQARPRASRPTSRAHANSDALAAGTNASARSEAASQGKGRDRCGDSTRCVSPDICSITAPPAVDMGATTLRVQDYRGHFGISTRGDFDDNSTAGCRRTNFECTRTDLHRCLRASPDRRFGPTSLPTAHFLGSTLPPPTPNTSAANTATHCITSMFSRDNAAARKLETSVVATTTTSSVELERLHGVASGTLHSPQILPGPQTLLIDAGARRFIRITRIVLASSAASHLPHQGHEVRQGWIQAASKPRQCPQPPCP
jgi:hypothetical protein